MLQSLLLTEPPSVVSSLTIITNENNYLVGTISTNEISYLKITGGPDASLFSPLGFTSTTSPFNIDLSFIQPPDYELPTDSNNDNEYIIEVTLTDQVGLSISRTLTITVKDIYDNPDTDGDGITDDSDLDDDNDGLSDTEENIFGGTDPYWWILMVMDLVTVKMFSLDPTEYIDTDGDDVGNNADPDDDDDGLTDIKEIEMEQIHLLLIPMEMV